MDLMKKLHKRLIVDMLALNIFIILVAFIVEVVISGISISIFGKGGC